MTQLQRFLPRFFIKLYTDIGNERRSVEIKVYLS